MGFPYLQPIKGWMVEEFKRREQLPEMESLKVPFAILTSAATVAKTNTYESAVSGETPKGITTYHGCIIHSNINPDINYSMNTNPTGQWLQGTSIGVDFDGKAVVVDYDGENGARRPSPIITSISIDTDGDNNALKTAQINLTLFTLKQLELFELFFCRPGYNLLLEFGNNFSLKENLLNEYKKIKGLWSSTSNTGKDTIFGPISGPVDVPNIESVLVPKNDYKTYVSTEFPRYVALNLDEQAAYHNKIINTLGNYDIFAGKVTNFTIEMGDNGTYNVMVELSAGNTVSMAIPNTIATDAVKIAGKDKNTLLKEEIILKQLRIDLNIPKLQIPLDYLKKHTFNFIKPQDLAKDSNVSELRYVTLDFVITHLVNYSSKNSGISGKEYKLEAQDIKIAGASVKGIPCNYQNKLISSSEDVIFPGQLPTILIGIDDQKRDELRLDEKNLRDCRINGLDFKISGNVEIPELVYNQKTKKIESNFKNYSANKNIGNALNIFVNYEQVVEIWQKSQTKADFINAVLSLINKNSYSVFNLVTAPIHGDAGGGPMTIIDRKFVHFTDKDGNDIKSPTEVYRFKTNGVNSIVRECTIQMDLGNLVAGQTVFQTSTAIEDALKKLKEKDNSLIGKQYSIPNSDTNDALANRYRNADGYYSVDGVELYVVKKYVDEELKQAENKKQFDDAEAKSKAKKDKKVTEKQPSASSVIDSKVLKFKIPKETGGSGKIEILILNDKNNVLKELNLVTEPSNKTLTNTTMTLTINGISGLSSGEYFRANGIPEIYNQNGVFQITNVKHLVDAQGWKTEIEAMWLIIS
jgi:hypothetical protein